MTHRHTHTRTRVRFPRNRDVGKGIFASLCVEGTGGRETTVARGVAWRGRAGDRNGTLSEGRIASRGETRAKDSKQLGQATLVAEFETTISTAGLKSVTATSCASNGPTERTGQAPVRRARSGQRAALLQPARYLSHLNMPSYRLMQEHADGSLSKTRSPSPPSIHEAKVRAPRPRTPREAPRDRPRRPRHAHHRWSARRECRQARGLRRSFGT